MKKVTFAILGMGNRGTKYASQQLKYGDRMEVTAMADTRRVRLDAANKYLHLPEDRLFDGADSLLSQPKLADILIVATQDAQHRDHALRAMEIGYDLLLEKPISNKLEDIAAIVAAAKRLGRRVIVCHVLRYTAFYSQAKALIDSGIIGPVVSVQAAEHVGYYHYAHSYVRGNWHVTAESSPMILAKCSHDMDILQWLTGKKCVSVSSFGQLSYFNAAHRPDGAPERSTGDGSVCWRGTGGSSAVSTYNLTKSTNHPARGCIAAPGFSRHCEPAPASVAIRFPYPAGSPTVTSAFVPGSVLVTVPWQRTLTLRMEIIVYPLLTMATTV